MASKKTNTATTLAERSEPEAIDRKPSEQEKLTVDLKTDQGQLSLAGTATAVIAALAVIGLVVLSIFVVKLAERAIDQKSISAPAPTSIRP